VGAGLQVLRWWSCALAAWAVVIAELGESFVGRPAIGVDDRSGSGGSVGGTV
jgi:hypothetical protein